jgi:hypothetical protein
MQYHHRQFNFISLGLFIAGFLVSLILTLIPAPIFKEFMFFEEFYQASIKGWEPYAIAISSAIVFVGVNFSSLVIEIDKKQIRWFYGIGLPTKKILLENIKSVTVVRTKWWQGWGIRLIGTGWMYNVFGLDGIKIVENSGKVTVLGSNDVKSLIHKLNKVRAVNSAEGEQSHG